MADGPVVPIPHQDVMALLRTLKHEALFLQTGAPQDASYSEKAEIDRNTTLRALNTVIDFIDMLDSCVCGNDGEPATLPLKRLFQALVDLNRGATGQLLKPGKSGKGAVPKPFHALHIEGQAAAVMELKMRAEVPREQAARLVVRLLQQHAPGLRLGDVRTSEPWKTVAAWRDAVTGAADPSERRDAYMRVMNGAAGSNLPPADVADQACRRLIRNAKQIVPRVSN